MYAGRDLKPRIKKSKHICENQGTAAFLHTNKLISVWNKMRLPRKKKKKVTQFQKSFSPSAKWILRCGSTDVYSWHVRGNVRWTVLNAQLLVLKVTKLCRSWGIFLSKPEKKEQIVGSSLPLISPKG